MSKLDKFSQFLTPESESLNEFVSPESESSVFKNIPISRLTEVRVLLKRISSYSNQSFRLRYRGPRYDSMRQTTLKRDAKAFSVYFV